MSEASAANNEVGEFGVPKTLNKVPEIVIKKRKNLKELVERRQREGSNNPRKRLAKNKFKFVRPEDLVSKHRLSKKDDNRMQRISRDEGRRITRLQAKEGLSQDNDDVESRTMKSVVVRPNQLSMTKLLKTGTYDQTANNILLAIRIREIKNSSGHCKKICNRLRLHKLYSAVLLPDTEKNRKELSLIDPYVTYGIPSHKLLRELVLKRGYLKKDKNQRMPLSDNRKIENLLGEYGIVCVEDIIHEIESAGGNMVNVLSLMWPFLLSKPKKAFPTIPVMFNKGGDAGDRGKAINDLLQTMN